MNPFIKPIDPIMESPRVRILAELKERPGQTMAQLAEHIGVVYSTVRSNLRTLRNEGKVRQAPSYKTANVKWFLGRDEPYLERIGYDREAAPVEFVPFRHPLDVALFGPAKTQPQQGE